MKLSQNDMHRIVEYIKSMGVSFDAADLADLDGTEEVLWTYGYHDTWSDEDLKRLRQELLPLGLQHEVAEIRRIVVQEAREQGWVVEE